MIEHVVVGHKWSPEESEELRFGWQALQRQLPASAKVLHTQASSMEMLCLEARRLLALQSSSNATKGTVLLLAHPHLALAPQTLSALETALQQAGDDAVCWAFDSHHTHNHEPIDYSTWRGLERYVERKNSDAALQSVATNQHAGLLGLVSLETLLSAQTISQLNHLHVPHAFAHDFSDYRSSSRAEVIHMVPQTARKVLDVGGGEGGFLKALQQSHGCETHLAEQDAQACAVAQGNVDHVWQGDFFSAPISEKFDCITFLDVLEHTTEPWKWLERAGSLLASQGTVVASIPNVGHWSVIADLLEGRWDYAPVGIHCITHLRFFTRHSIQALFAQAGFVLEAIDATHVAPPPWWHTDGMNAATSNALKIEADSLSAYAFLVRARLK